MEKLVFNTTRRRNAWLFTSEILSLTVLKHPPSMAKFDEIKALIGSEGIRSLLVYKMNPSVTNLEKTMNWPARSAKVALRLLMDVVEPLAIKHDWSIS